VKYQVRDRFSPGESTDVARQKWSPDDVMYWNIVAGLKWERTVFNPRRLAGVPLLDYGCNVGALSWLARSYGATALTLVDVPGAALNFAGSLFQGDVAVLPVTSDAPPSGLADRKVGIAYCYHVLEHVPDPMAVVRAIHQSLTPGGVFSVTYASMPETEGGCNLRVAQDVRPEVLAFMRSAFRVLEWNEARVEYLLEKR
jgi:2-polyprenyl-3-methyl-5-hydroxy-6-metoxy-1,4-benzoquinol methylase